MSSSKAADRAPPAGANRLIFEKSPYLLQHAHNPVDWHPWSPAAFELARTLNKPIFLSIGYSTCHWCHVMEHESFSSAAIAAIMNERFVNIKVDREQNPDVDRVYMTYVQATTGGGGWPMSVFLTPELKPIFGGTYFPPTDRWNQPGFETVLEGIADLWERKSSDMRKDADMMVSRLRDALAAKTSSRRTTPLGSTASGDAGVAGDNTAVSLEKAMDELATWTVHDTCLRQLEASFDSKFGGFGPAPKFPTPVTFAFLTSVAELRAPPSLSPGVSGAVNEMPAAARYAAARRLGLVVDSEPTVEELTTAYKLNIGRAKSAEHMARHTLDCIARGGVHDHVGKGFHRYSVDKEWHVPHFEKMLYDQAQLLTAYSRIHRLSRVNSSWLSKLSEAEESTSTGSSSSSSSSSSNNSVDYSSVVREILEYVHRDLTCAETGAFYSAEDADSYPTKEAASSPDGKKTEGAFCVWQRDELDRILGAGQSSNTAAAAVFAHHFDVRADGNVSAAKDPHGELTHKNVLRIMHSVEETAAHFNMTVDEVQRVLDESLQKLAAYRFEHRPRPHRDEKIVTVWNAMMISACARASRALLSSSAHQQDGETDSALNAEFAERAKQMALSAAAFLRSTMYKPADGGILMRSYCGGGIADVRGFADDYAWCIAAALDLYDVTLDEEWIDWAVRLQLTMDTLFYDGAAGEGDGEAGYFSTEAGAANIILRLKEDYDGAEPSANSVAVDNLARLGRMLGGADGDDVALGSRFKRQAEAILAHYNSAVFTSHPRSLMGMLAASVSVIVPELKIILVDSSSAAAATAPSKEFSEMLDAVHARKLHHWTVIAQPRPDGVIAKHNETVKAIVAGAYDTATVFVCEGNTCSAPITDVRHLLEHPAICTQ